MTDTPTTLPLQKDVDIFLRVFFTEYKHKRYYLVDLTREVIEFFSVSPEDAVLQYQHTHKQTCEDTSRIEQLTNWGCVHLLRDGTIVRTGPNEYQHHRGRDAAILISLFDEALAFMKHARKLEFTLGQAKSMVADKWDADILEKAGQAAFEPRHP